MRTVLLLLLIAASAYALEKQEALPDPATWTLEGENLRALHASTLEELLREIPLLRVESFGGAGLPLRATTGPWPQEEILVLLDGLPYRDPWTGEAQIPYLPLSLIDKLEFSRGPELLEFGAPASAGVLRVSTHRHQGSRARAYFHVNPLMIREPWTERFSVETPPGGVSLTVGLDSYHRSLTRFSEREGGETVVPEIDASRRRTLLTRLSLDAGAAGPLDFQLIQSRTTLSLMEGSTEFREGGLYRLSLAAPETPAGEFLLAQTSVEKSTEFNKSGWLGFQLRWARRESFLGIERLGAHAGYEWQDPGWELNGAPADLGEVARGFASLAWRETLPSGFRLSAGGRIDGESGRDAALAYQLGLSKNFRARPFRLELHAAGGTEREVWLHDRFPGEWIWPSAATVPGGGEPRAFSRMGGSLGAYSQDWDWSLGYRRFGTGEYWAVSGIDWQRLPYESGSSASFSGRARMRPLSRVLDWTLDTLFFVLGAGRDRPRGDLDGTFLFEQAFGEETRTRLRYLRRIRLGFDYLRPIAEGDGHWRIASPLEIRQGAEAESLTRWDLRIELRVLDGRLWMQLRDVLDAGGEEIAGYPMPGREYMVGVDWVLFN